jgi:hydroxymethylbilane synthase
MASTPSLVIGTRGSPLALAQARLVEQALVAAESPLGEPGAIETRVIKTTGDHVLDRPLAELGGKGLFTKEIEEALLAGAIDLAVHSCKDMPTVLPSGLAIAACLARADPRDALVCEIAERIEALPEGAVLGTASLRRAAQALCVRHDLRVVPLRGAVGTRLRKLAAGEVDATFLAMAGLDRLGVRGAPIHPLAPEAMLPAVGQGAIAIEARIEDARVAGLLARVADAPTMAAVRAERALLAELGGSCRTPIAALCVGTPEGLWLRGLVARPDGSEALRAERRGAVGEAQALGRDAGRELRRRAGPAFFAG